MTAPFRYMDAPTLLGSWPILPSFSGYVPAVVPRVLLTRASVLGSRREDSSGFDIDGKVIDIYVDAHSVVSVTFSSAAPMTLDEVIARVNAVVGASPVGADIAFRDNGFLRLESPTAGENSYLRVATNTASGPQDVFYELGILSGSESFGGDIASTPIADPGRQVTQHGQMSMAHGEDINADVLNRTTLQLAISSDYNRQFWHGRRLAKTDQKDFAISSDGFTLTGEDVYCGTVPSPGPLDSVIVILRQNGDEVVTESDTVLQSGQTYDFWFDPDTREQHVKGAAAIFVSTDPKGNLFIRSNNAALGDLQGMSLKILEFVDTTEVVVMNVVPSGVNEGQRVEVGTPSVHTVVADGERLSISASRLYVEDFTDGVGGLSVIQTGTPITGAPISITRIEGNNRIVLDTATLETDGVQVGDLVVLTGHSGALPFTNNGNYRVLRVIDEKSLDVMKEDYGPAFLNPTGTSLGTIQITSDGDFFHEPYVKLNYAPDSGTYKVVFKKRSSFQDIAADIDGFATSPLEFVQENASEVQKVILGIIGPSATNYTDFLYGDQRISLEGLNYRLDSQHDEVGRHTDILASSLCVDGDTGIGTNSPSTRLHVKQTGAHTYLNIESDATYRSRVQFTQGGAARWSLGVQGTLTDLVSWDNSAGENWLQKVGDGPLYLQGGGQDTVIGGLLSIDRTGDAAKAELMLISDDSQYAGINLLTGTSRRWYLDSSNDPESGSEAGSNFELHRYDDSGSWLGRPLLINRATGLITLDGDVAFGGVRFQMEPDGESSIAGIPGIRFNFNDATYNTAFEYNRASHEFGWVIDNAYKMFLGASKLYLDGNLEVNGGLITSVSTSGALVLAGGSDNNGANIELYGGSMSGSAVIDATWLAIRSQNGGTDYATFSSSGLSVNGAFGPISDGSADIGSTSVRWANAYSNYFHGREGLYLGESTSRGAANGGPNQQVIIRTFQSTASAYPVVVFQNDDWTVEKVAGNQVRITSRTTGSLSYRIRYDNTLDCGISPTTIGTTFTFTFTYGFDLQLSNSFLLKSSVRLSINKYLSDHWWHGFLISDFMN